MELENKIKQKLRLRGFTEKQLLNNRGLIGATIDEVKLMLGKNLAIQDVSQQRELLPEFLMKDLDGKIVTAYHGGSDVTEEWNEYLGNCG